MIKLDDEVSLFGIIPNNMITNKNIDDNVVSVYIVMRTLNFDINRSCSIITLHDLYNVLNVDATQGKQTKIIHDAIIYLIENKYIKLYDMLNNEIDFNTKNKFMLKVSFLLEDEENRFIGDGGFTKIPEYNLICLLNYIRNNKGIKKYLLIRYYLLVARLCSNDTQMSNLSSHKYFNRIINISTSTCSNYNQILADLGIIFYNSDYVQAINNIKNAPTIFFHRNNNEIGSTTCTMTQDKFNLIIEELADNYEWIEIDKDEINNKRSETMKKVWKDRKKNYIDNVEELKEDECEKY